MAVTNDRAPSSIRRPLRYPGGSPMVKQLVDSRVLARALAWATEEAGAGGAAVDQVRLSQLSISIALIMPAQRSSGRRSRTRSSCARPRTASCSSTLQSLAWTATTDSSSSQALYSKKPWQVALVLGVEGAHVVSVVAAVWIMTPRSTLHRS